MNIIRKQVNDIDEKLRNEMENFINNYGLVFHQIKFLEIASVFFNQKNNYLLAYENETLVGVCPVSFKKRGILRICYSNDGASEMLYGGWIYRNSDKYFKDIYENTKLGLFESIIFYPSFLNHTLETTTPDKDYMTGLIDLGTSEAEIWEKSIRSKRRNMIRKAEKEGVIIKSFGVEGLPTYFELNKQMRLKVGLVTNPIKYYEDILKWLTPLNSTILIAYVNDIPVSGIVLLANDNATHYWQGASISESKNFGQGELLQWHGIRWAKNRRSKYYDLGIIEPKRLPHIAQFKSGFTKEFIELKKITKKTVSFRLANKIQKFIGIK